ncbi:translin [Biomphalaria glabrata]|uniref:Translin n=2 Tax=Biomphalaria glabrata TaxID=6526 RepID=A0A9W2YBJ9_BIOGL|nr:translin-like isoform X1 [Biomphalaria glabrata]KAI8730324.1 translin-like; partial [Biomphalaria glabrata]
MTTSASEILSHFQEYLNAEHDLREEIRIVVRDLEQTVREIQTSLQPIHQPAQTANYLSFCENALSMFHKIQEHYKQLSSKIPLNQYYRFNDHWRFVTQRVVYMCALIIYLKEERLVSREEVADMIGVQVNREDGFHIDLDDYLMGILNLTNELSRLAMNAVTAGDYSRPLRISQFIGELDAGFRLLNLKNDALRKKFDGLKYDVKKCEEVVYDLTIRGLVNKVVDNVNKS